MSDKSQEAEASAPLTIAGKDGGRARRTARLGATQHHHFSSEHGQSQAWRLLKARGLREGVEMLEGLCENLPRSCGATTTSTSWVAARPLT
jgi:hypothetical protein